MSRRLAQLAPLALILSAGCSHDSVDFTGVQLTALFSEDSSLSLSKGVIDLEGFDQTWNVDCRELDDEAFRLPDNLPICEGTTIEGEQVDFPFTHEVTANFSGYRGAFIEDVEVFRSEAMITSEGDFQFNFHFKLPGTSEGRIAIAINPIFQPRRCVETEEGVVGEPLDGNWVEQWSTDLAKVAANDDGLYPEWMVADATDLPNGSMYYLNALSYQFNPKDTCERWTLPNRWRAGYSQGKFGEEYVTARSSRYGTPGAYVATDADDTECVAINDIYYTAVPEGSDPTDSSAWRSMMSRAGDDILLERNELAALTPEGVPFMAPVIHDNAWRVPDSVPGGLDGWADVHYAYVIIDEGSDLSVGGTASGAFSILLRGTDSQSIFHIHGRFATDTIRKDKWTAPYLPDIKREEAGTVSCY